MFHSIRNNYSTLPGFDVKPFLKYLSNISGKNKKNVVNNSNEELINAIYRYSNEGFHYEAHFETTLELNDDSDYRFSGELAPKKASVFYTFSQHAKDAIILVDNHGKIIYWNPAASATFGYSQEEILGKVIHKVLAPDLYKESARQGLEIFSTSGNGSAIGKTIDLTALKKDGTEIPVELSLSAIKLENEWYAIGIVRDITERISYEKRLSALHNCANALAIATNVDEIYDVIMNTVEVVLGYEYAGIAILKENSFQYIRMIGAPLSVEVSIQMDSPSVTGRAYSTKKIQVINNTQIDPEYHRIADSSNVPLMLSELAVPILVEDCVRMIINIERDRIDAFNEIDVELIKLLSMHVSSALLRIHHEEKINMTLRDLQKINQKLDDYTYAVSHDLKSPLRTIKSFSAYLLEEYVDVLDEKGIDYIKRMKNTSRRMEDLIEELLLMSKVGRKNTELERVSIDKVINSILLDIQDQIEKKHAEIIVETLPTINTQKVWIKILFANLINNGIKFNKASTPIITVSCSESPEQYVFSVKDNGIGIDEIYHERIFKLFERLHTQEEYPGTGAGLSLCKKIVEEMGGKIWVENNNQQDGSTFIFTIPYLNIAADSSLTSDQEKSEHAMSSYYQRAQTLS